MSGKWEQLFKDILPAIAELEKLSPGTLEGKRALDAAGEKTNVLGPKVRELIAIAVGVTTRCGECVSRHAQLAVKYGATKEEVAEAVGVAVALNAGAAVAYAAKAIEAVNEYSQNPSKNGTSSL